jgi:RND family efflux transporter MFP subunit
MEFNRKVIIISLIAIVTIAFIFLIFKKPAEEMKNSKDSAEISENNNRPEFAAIRVKTAKVFRGDLKKRISTFGTAKPEAEVIIRPQIDGLVKKIFISEGDRIKKGQDLFHLYNEEALVRLDKAKINRINAYAKFLIQETDYRGNINDSRERIETAEEEYRTAKMKFDKGLITQNDLLDKERNLHFLKEMSKINRSEIVKINSGLSPAELELKESELNLARTEIKAPFSGIATEIKIYKGQFIQTSFECLTLVKFDNVVIEAELLESEISAVKKGGEAVIEFTALPGEKYKGIIKAISPLINPDNKTGKLFVEIKNKNLLIKPGMFAQIRLDTHTFSDRLLVPREAVLTRDEKKLVFVVKDGLAQWAYIKTGLENEEYIEILPDPLHGVIDVREGDVVITEGHMALAHNAHVKIIN